MARCPNCSKKVSFYKVCDLCGKERCEFCGDLKCIECGSNTWLMRDSNGENVCAEDLPNFEGEVI